MSPRGRAVDPMGTIDLLELLNAPPEPAPAPAVVAVPEHRPALAACHCSDRRAHGFTSPRPGWWVHAGCGLPTIEFAASAVARAGSASPVELGAPTPAPPPRVVVPPDPPAPVWPVRERKPEWPPRRPEPVRRRIEGNPAHYTYARVTREGTGVVTDGAMTRERIAELRAQGWTVTPWAGSAPDVPESHRWHPERITP